MLGNLGLLAGVTLLIYLALRGINIFIASLVWRVCRILCNLGWGYYCGSLPS